jgi:hypothetical protein
MVVVGVVRAAWRRFMGVEMLLPNYSSLLI